MGHAEKQQTHRLREWSFPGRNPPVTPTQQVRVQLSSTTPKTLSKKVMNESFASHLCGDCAGLYSNCKLGQRRQQQIGN